MRTALSAAELTAIDARLAATDDLLARAYPGDDGSRQPVHTVYVPADRFTPELTFVVSHGTGRENVYDRIRENDLAITTYGTLVRDLDKLREIDFDLVVLDEAQAIKNRATQAAEACCQLRAGQRLALTGTPVENHLGELWSIFEFLNPGLLGSLPKISEYAGRLRLPPEALAEVARALRPLILRRKKGDVLAVARVAGIQAAKKTADLVPLCHPLPLARVGVEFTFEPCRLRATATVKTVAPTGVEMEALAAVAVALLTVYDMCKAVDPAMEIGGVHLVSKTKSLAQPP